ncbi:hypothetical protein CKO15_05605 [Halorhodospira abdelmalekii]|nr:response regulator transcription factor [Halorhodospira abdelmalekii]MBK1734772.1 hypothetical protein [Halorhodospira abdelmalekii]
MLVNAQRMNCQAVAQCLDRVDDLKVVATVTCCKEAIEIAGERRPDVIVIDLDMPGMGGFEAIRRLCARNDGPRVLAISAHECTAHPRHALRLGARGCMTKHCATEELCTAIRQIHGGRPYVSPLIGQWLALGSLAGERSNPFDGLTAREMQVLMGIFKGYKNQRIAADLCLSPKTISNHRSSLYRRLAVQNEAELVRLAIEHGLAGAVTVLKQPEPELPSSDPSGEGGVGSGDLGSPVNRYIDLVDEIDNIDSFLDPTGSTH